MDAVNYVDAWLLCMQEYYIDRYIREDNAEVIYWCHRIGHWKYLRGSDTTLYRQEKTKLIEQINNGTIVNVNKGLVVNVLGTQLYPIEIELKDVKCHAYFMVAKRGLTDDLKMTPYFFLSEEKRDEIFDYLITKGTSVKTSCA
jgi:hypothetical protein